MSNKVCLILGAGKGLGYSLGKKWASKGYQVVVTRRSSSDPEEIRKEIGESAVAFPCDVTDAEQVSELVDMVEVKFGPIEMLLYNAGSGVFKTFDEVSIEEFEKSFSTNATGLLSAAKAVCPRMQERGFGVVGITGATASLRGKPFTAGFAPAKAGQRMLAQSLARQLGPKNIHVFYAIIDGQIERGTKDDSGRMNPDDIAETYWTIAQQNKTCWAFEVDLRPFNEKW